MNMVQLNTHLFSLVARHQAAVLFTAYTATVVVITTVAAVIREINCFLPVFHPAFMLPIPEALLTDNL